MGKSAGHKAKKKFGQNFLQDHAIIERILKSIGVSNTDNVLEIGPGLGALSEALFLNSQLLKVIEIDNDLIPKLERKFAHLCQQHGKAAEQWEIIHQDALTVSLETIAGSLSNTLNNKKLRVVGNLPYNISTPLLFHFMNELHCIEDMHFMLQKEVVDRICAEPNNKSYGRLTVMLQYYCECENLFEVPPESFDPQPKVDSAIVRLVPYEILPYPCKDLDLLSKLVTQAFSQRRKTLRNNLKAWKIEDAIEQSSLDHTLRPENISVAEYVELCNILSSSNYKLL